MIESTICLRVSVNLPSSSQLVFSLLFLCRFQLVLFEFFGLNTYFSIVEWIDLVKCSMIILISVMFLVCGFKVPGWSLRHCVYFFQFINLFVICGEDDIGCLTPKLPPTTMTFSRYRLGSFFISLIHSMERGHKYAYAGTS